MESWVGPGNKAKHSLYVGMCSLVPRLRPDGKLGGARNKAKHSLYVVEGKLEATSNMFYSQRSMDLVRSIWKPAQQ